MQTSDPVLRILMVVLNLDFGGQERMIVDLSRSLKARGYLVSVCCLAHAGPLSHELEDSGIDVIALGKADGFSVATAKQLRALIRREQIDVVHSHNTPGLIYSALALLGFGIFRKVTHINTRHGEILASKRAFFLNRLANRRAARIVVVSDELTDYLAKHEASDPRKVRVIINGIDTTQFCDIEPAPVDSNFPTIAHVARLSEIKNQPLLLRAHAQLLKEFPAARLLIVGDGPCRESLEQLADELSISDSVEFLGMQRNVAQFIARCHWFALSSLSEGTPMSILEAMAAGRAVTSTNVGGVGKLIEQGENGFLSELDDEDGYVANWLKLARNPDLLRNCGVRARADAIAKYSADVMTDKYVAEYQQTGQK